MTLKTHEAMAVSATEQAAPIASKFALKAKIELIREDIVATMGVMQNALAAGSAMAGIPNDAGLLHGLRRPVRVGNLSPRSAYADSFAAHAELESIFRRKKCYEQALRASAWLRLWRRRIRRDAQSTQQGEAAPKVQ